MVIDMFKKMKKKFLLIAKHVIIREKFLRNLCLLFVILITTSSCSGFTLALSGGGLVLSQNPLAKAYNGVDLITVIKTDKSIKTHIYETIKEKE